MPIHLGALAALACGVLTHGRIEQQLDVLSRRAVQWPAWVWGILLFLWSIGLYLVDEAGLVHKAFIYFQF